MGRRSLPRVVIRVRRQVDRPIRWFQVAFGAVAFWAWALGLASLSLSFDDRYRAEPAAAIATPGETDVFAGERQVLYGADRDPGAVPRAHGDPSGLARLRSSVPRPSKVPSLGLDPLLSEADRAAPLRDLEADEGVRARIEPDRFPSLDSLESRRWRW